ncbi:hypothetical protein C8R41DRAFT_893389 [Lentinula lateritia]|uniref:WW domain-containing protein n=1 Tax=Lentinula lateritia TaxID=40482 RepID=A0ABQ8VSW7_9AGAR|nr:hypothetical protein C8R41DRAFT_893389 [Lentinula lateritia]
MSSNNINNLPLPYGWVEQRSPDGHRFYVDTKANPPRSIWTHPYEDEQYLHEHPDVREKMRTSISNQELRSSRSDHKQSNYDDRDTRRHSYNGQSSSSSRSPGHNRGFFGKLKDKAIGTTEERQAEKARAAQIQEQRRQQRLAQQQAYYNQAQYAPPPQQYGNRYGGYGGTYGSGGLGGLGGMSGRRTGGMGMGGMALPLIGGMAGGLLLGEALGDFGGGGFDNGGFGGGGFDGGGFGGGGFDGGGFDNGGGGGF